jgi:hypothetical protein
LLGNIPNLKECITHVVDKLRCCLENKRIASCVQKSFSTKSQNRHRIMSFPLYTGGPGFPILPMDLRPKVSKRSNQKVEADDDDDSSLDVINYQALPNSDEAAPPSPTTQPTLISYREPLKADPLSPTPAQTGLSSTEEAPQLKEPIDTRDTAVRLASIKDRLTAITRYVPYYHH